MKTLSLIITITLLSMSIFFAFLLNDHQSGRTEVAEQAGGDAYVLTASFDGTRTTKVRHFIDSCLKVNKQLPAKDQVILQYALSDGELRVEADKRKNTAAAMIRIKSMYQDIRYHIIPR